MHAGPTTAIYVDDFPALSIEAAEMIRTDLLNVKAVAIDTLSIESCTRGPKSGFAVHKTLLDGEMYRTRPLLIFEDVNMGPILEKSISRIFAFPLRLGGAGRVAREHDRGGDPRHAAGTAR